MVSRKPKKTLNMSGPFDIGCETPSEYSRSRILRERFRRRPYRGPAIDFSPHKCDNPSAGPDIPIPQERQVIMNEPRRPLFEHKNRKRPVGYWIVALLVVLAVIVLLPKLIDRLA